MFAVARGSIAGLAAFAVALALAPAARGAQGFNLDFGTVFGTPATSYGGATTQAGTWNQIGLGVSQLDDLSGVASGVSVDLVAGNDNGNSLLVLSNDDELLLNDYFFSVNDQWSVSVSGLTPGNYRVALYAPSNFLVWTGDVLVAGVLVPSIPGSTSGTLIEGMSWVRVEVTVTQAPLSLSSSGSFIAGLAGLQIVPVPVSVSYCTAGTSASGCTALVSSTGHASATAPSGFTLEARGVEGESNGLYFFGANGRQAIPWGNGSSFQCVMPPVKRTRVIMGVGTAEACDGAFAQDLNALWCATCPMAGVNPGAGATVQAQLWYRDPQNTGNQTTSLSDAIEFAVGL